MIFTAVFKTIQFKVQDSRAVKPLVRVETQAIRAY